MVSRFFNNYSCPNDCATFWVPISPSLRRGSGQAFCEIGVLFNAQIVAPLRPREPQELVRKTPNDRIGMVINNFSGMFSGPPKDIRNRLDITSVGCYSAVGYDAEIRKGFADGK